MTQRATSVIVVGPITLVGHCISKRTGRVHIIAVSEALDEQVDIFVEPEAMPVDLWRLRSFASAYFLRVVIAEIWRAHAAAH